MALHSEQPTDDYLFQLPPDVAADALPLVGVTGLNINHHASHSFIWQSLVDIYADATLTTTKTRIDNNNVACTSPPPFRIMHVAPDHEFPPKKSKRSYEMGGYVGGLFKSNWLHKHLYELPAVICHFVELDWEHAAFDEKEIEISSKIRTMRAGLAGRNTLFCVVLLQSKIAPQQHQSIRYSPTNTDNTSNGPEKQLSNGVVVANERHASLARACDIPVKQILTMPFQQFPTTDSGASTAVESSSGVAVESRKVFQNNFKRIEPVLFSLSASYYAGETKRIRALRDNLQRIQNSAFLLIRHQMKQAFFQEMCQEPFQALHFYRAAHVQLKEIRITPAFMHEVKTVAMILLYKICRLLLGKPSAAAAASSSNNALPLKASQSSSSTNVRDAIDHFKAHRAHYKTYQGLPELEYEHEAWLCRQHMVFAELLAGVCEISPTDSTTVTGKAVVSRFTTSGNNITNEHAGIFYREAATHCQRRKFLVNAAIAVAGLPAIESYAGIPSPLQADFYGQRRVLKQISQPPALYHYLLAQEMRLNYPRLMIALLSKALLYYRHMQLDSQRMQWMLLVMIGDEYTQLSEYELALTYMSKALNEYQQEKWYALVGRVAPGTLNCAVRSANFLEFILCSLTLQSQRLASVISSEFRRQVFRDFQQLVEFGQSPVGKNNEKSDNDTAVAAAWKRVLHDLQQQHSSSTPLHVRIDAHTTCAPLFQLDAAFVVDSSSLSNAVGVAVVPSDGEFRILLAVRSLCCAPFTFHTAQITLTTTTAAAGSNTDSNTINIKRNVIANGSDSDNGILLALDPAKEELSTDSDSINIASEKSVIRKLLCTSPVVTDAEYKDAAASAAANVVMNKTFHISQVCLSHKCAFSNIILHWLWKFPPPSPLHTSALHHPSANSNSNSADAGVEQPNFSKSYISRVVSRTTSNDNRPLLPSDAVRSCRVIAREPNIDVKISITSSNSGILRIGDAERLNEPIHLLYGESFHAQLSIMLRKDLTDKFSVRDLHVNVSAVEVLTDDTDDDDENDQVNSEQNNGMLSPSSSSLERARVVGAANRASVDTVVSRTQTTPLLFAVSATNENDDAVLEPLIKFHLEDFDAGTAHDLFVKVCRARLPQQLEIGNEKQNNVTGASATSMHAKLVVRGTYSITPLVVSHSTSNLSPPRSHAVSFDKRIPLILNEPLASSLRMYSGLFGKQLDTNNVQPNDLVYGVLTLVVNNSRQASNSSQGKRDEEEVIEISKVIPSLASLQVLAQQNNILPFSITSNVKHQQEKMCVVTFSVDIDAELLNHQQTNALGEFSSSVVELGSITVPWRRRQSNAAAAAASGHHVSSSSSSNYQIRLPTLSISRLPLPLLISVHVVNAVTYIDDNDAAAGGDNSRVFKSFKASDLKQVAVVMVRRPFICAYTIKSTVNVVQEFENISLEFDNEQTKNSSSSASSAFLVSGSRSWSNFSLAPRQQQTIQVCLVPTRTGTLSLPKLSIKSLLHARGSTTNLAAAQQQQQKDEEEGAEEELQEMLMSLQAGVVHVAAGTV